MRNALDELAGNVFTIKQSFNWIFAEVKVFKLNLSFEFLAEKLFSI